MPPAGRNIDFLNMITKCKLIHSRDSLSRQIIFNVLTIMFKWCLKSQKSIFKNPPKHFFGNVKSMAGDTLLGFWQCSFAVFATLRMFLKLGIYAKVIVFYPDSDTKVEPLNSDQTAWHFLQKRHETGKRFTVSFSIWNFHCASADRTRGC